MLKNFVLFFLALRAADLLNLAGGMWLVPKYVSPEELGAVLPLTSFATLIAIPLYAIAMTTLREAARLRSLQKSPRSLIRGVFAAVGIAAILALAVAAALLPYILARFRVTDSISGYLAIAAAFLGCISPVYLDQLQAAKRFGTVSIVEIVSATLRLGVMAVTMPFRALAGYFAGSIAKPITKIFCVLLALRGEMANGKDACYWTRANFIRFGKIFCLLLPYLWLPLMASMMENDLIRTMLPSADSAGYYMATRISDLLNYISFPILFVIFPYVTDKAEQGKSYAKVVLGSCGVIIGIVLVAMLLTHCWGANIIALMPNGENYTEYAKYLPMLFLFMAAGASQAIVTNAEVAAGRFSFLWWFVPLNLVYLALLPRMLVQPSLDELITIFTLFAVIRFFAAMLQVRLSSVKTTPKN